MNSTKSDYQNINLIVQSITTKEEKDYTYVTLDGFKGFTFPCPICSPNGKRKTIQRNGFIFAKGPRTALAMVVIR